MVQKQIALLCTTLLFWCSLAEGARSQFSPAVKPAGLKERLTLIPAGSIVEVKLVNRQKLRGRLGSVSDSGFEIQHTRDDQIVTESVAFDGVKSVTVTGKGMHFAAKVVIGTLISIGVVALVGVILCASAGCGD